MSGFSISANHYLRVIYAGNTDVMKKTDRQNVSSSRLSHADSTALRKGLARLADYDFEHVGDNESRKNDFYNTLKAFSDAYNNTLDSGLSSQNSSITELTNKLKDSSQKHAKELSDYGITFDDNGYMHVRQSAVNNISATAFADVVGKKAEYSKELSEIAKKLSKHVDIAV